MWVRNQNKRSTVQMTVRNSVFHEAFRDLGLEHDSFLDAAGNLYA